MKAKLEYNFSIEKSGEFFVQKILISTNMILKLKVQVHFLQRNVALRNKSTFFMTQTHSIEGRKKGDNSITTFG